MTAANATTAPGPASFDLVPERQKGWLETKLGPDNYRIVHGLLTNPLSIIGMILIAAFVLVALCAPLLAPQVGRDAYVIPRDGFSDTPRPPMTPWGVRPPPLPFWWGLTGEAKWVHLMGTAAGQWDIWYGLIWGTRTALFVGIVITLTALVVGLTVGSLSAYYGGTLDNILMRITEIFMAFPFLMAALTLSAVLTPVVGKGIWPATIALIAFGWMGYARIIRGDILTTKERDYVLAARTIGVNDGGILMRHIIPNAVYPTLVVASLDVGSYVITFAALSFLGVGAEVGYADWGQIIAFARPWISQLQNYWDIVAYPGAALILFGLAWNLVGDALRDVMDPKLKGRGG